MFIKLNSGALAISVLDDIYMGKLQRSGGMTTSQLMGEIRSALETPSLMNQMRAQHYMDRLPLEVAKQYMTFFRDKISKRWKDNPDCRTERRFTRVEWDGRIPAADHQERAKRAKDMLGWSDRFSWHVDGQSTIEGDHITQRVWLAHLAYGSQEQMVGHTRASLTHCVKCMGLSDVYQVDCGTSTPDHSLKTHAHWEIRKVNQWSLREPAGEFSLSAPCQCLLGSNRLVALKFAGHKTMACNLCYGSGRSHQNFAQLQHQSMGNEAIVNIIKACKPHQHIKTHAILRLDRAPNFMPDAAIDSETHRVPAVVNAYGLHLYPDKAWYSQIPRSDLVIRDMSSYTTVHRIEHGKIVPISRHATSVLEPIDWYGHMQGKEWRELDYAHVFRKGAGASMEVES